MDPKLLILFNDNHLALKLHCALKIKRNKRIIFNLEKYTDEECLNYFRFVKDDIKKLRRLLRIPSRFNCRNGTPCFGTEGLCILLRRMAYPNRLVDLKLMFHRSTSNLSMIFNYVLDHIMRHFQHLLTNLNQEWLSNNLRTFAETIQNKGSPLSRCWGFIDGTVRPMCRPSKYQKECYNGHKRVHALKYQSVVVPNGIIANLFGPVEGRRHDAYLLSESNILAKLAEMNAGHPEPYYLYGDPAYPLRPELQGPFKGSRITREQAEFNKRMSMSRITVEWGFGKILSLWAFTDFKKNQCLYKQPLSKYFKVATLLTNIHTCINCNQISDFFGILPPKVEDYLLYKD